MNLTSQNAGSPDRCPSTPTHPLDPALTNRLLNDLVEAIPHTKDTDRRAQREDARAVLLAMHPRNALEAALAVHAIAAWHAAMDNFKRAAQPGTSNEAALRLRGNALSNGRCFETALRMLQKQHAPPRPAPAALTPPKGSVNRTRPLLAPTQPAPQIESLRKQLATAASPLALSAFDKKNGAIAGCLT